MVTPDTPLRPDVLENDRTRQYYDNVGWTECDGKPVDAQMFHSEKSGPIRTRLTDLRWKRIRGALGHASGKLKLLECGCGGFPAVALFEMCREYTGVDFSATGLALASKRLEGLSLPVQLVNADICRLPFPDASFDAVYSAHAIYHIPNSEDQSQALAEMVRVTRPGGVVVVISANPRPLLFPLRLMRQLISEVPVLRRVAEVWFPHPIPYRPMALSRLRRETRRLGDASLTSAGVPSNWFARRVDENRGIGKILWSVLGWLEVHCPELAISLGSYILITIRKPAVS